MSSPLTSPGSGWCRKRGCSVHKGSACGQSALKSSSPRIPSSPPAFTPHPRLPVASTIDEYLEFTNSRDPQPEWYSHNPAPLNKDCETALHIAIRKQNTQAALALIHLGAPLYAVDRKGNLPLLFAAQFEDDRVVNALLQRGADPRNSANQDGTTPVLQACHFGRLSVLKSLLFVGGNDLIEVPNANLTTPLMRAAQEGHLNTVRYLLEQQALPNKKNHAHLTAIMLASQRGHAAVVQTLLDFGADMDLASTNDSTALMLASKRGHVNVVQVLVTNGCEIWKRDNKGRSARDVAKKRQHTQVLEWLDSSVQIYHMQRQTRQFILWELWRHYKLAQQGRAVLRRDHLPDASFPAALREIEDGKYSPTALVEALVRTWALPSPLVEHIVMFLPLPRLWDERLQMLTRQAIANSDVAVIGIFDLIDEVLEEGGLVGACDQAVPPPPDFCSWAAWRAYGRCRTRNHAPEPERPRLNLTVASNCSAASATENMTIYEFRRRADFLGLLADRSTTLAATMTSLGLPPMLLSQLVTSSDVASVARRLDPTSVHFHPRAAMDLLALASSLVSWCERDCSSMMAYGSHDRSLFIPVPMSDEEDSLEEMAM